jgi:hypothetical protein
MEREVVGNHVLGAKPSSCNRRSVFAGDVYVADGDNLSNPSAASSRTWMPK